MNSSCMLCNDSLSKGKVVSVGQKGLSTLITTSRRREDNIEENLQGKTRIDVHEECRKRYTRESSIKADLKTSASSLPASAESFSPVKKKLRCAAPAFNYTVDCLICDETCSEEIERKLNKERRRTIHQVQSTQLRESLLELCRGRKDVKAKIVQKRVQGALCLFAEEPDTTNSVWISSVTSVFLV